jgi:hypothetical protein
MPRGRPKTSPLTRAEQLRAAKRAQRWRERAAGVVYVQVKLDRAVALKLTAAARIKGFPEQLDKLLDDAVVRLADYPALADLAWNRRDEYLPALEAFRVYERNWRFVDRDRLSIRERDLLQRLSERFGAGLINA